MAEPNDQTSLRTSIGDVPLEEYHLRLAGREWTILHTGVVLSEEDEQRLLGDASPRLPYGVSLWPASIALAHDLVARADSLPGRHILELGAGTGLAGIVAASLGARVLQTDRHELPMSMCARNSTRNAVNAIEHRLADWTLWDDATQYDLIIGADVLYAERMHNHLRRIFESNLRPGGRILLADPFRPVSLALLQAMETDGWTVGLATWRVGEPAAPRQVGVFELTPP